MSLAGRLARGPALERAIDVSDDPYAAWWRSALGATRSFTGRTVSVESALQVDALAACVQLLSGTVGGFPLKTYEGEIDGERKAVPRHPTYELLHRRPNPELPPVQFWGLAMTHLLTEGDAFLGKTFLGKSGKRVGELWPIRPQRVVVKRVDGRKLFVLDGNHDEPLDSSTIIHIQGFTLDGVRGMSPIGLAREALGAGLAIDEYTNRFFANSALPVGVLETDNSLSDGAQRRLKRDWNRKYGGLRNAGRVAVLEEGLKFHALSLPFKDLEFVSLQNLSARKIARIYRIPASMIDAEAQSGKGLHYSSTASDDLQFLKHTVRVWLKRIAQTIMLDDDLFPRGSGLFCEHVVADLLQLDAKTQSEVRAKETGGVAWRLPSEVRRQDNLDPVPELDDAAISAAQHAARLAAGSPQPDEPEAEPDDE